MRFKLEKIFHARAIILKFVLFYNLIDLETPKIGVDWNRQPDDFVNDDNDMMEMQ